MNLQDSDACSPQHLTTTYQPKKMSQNNQSSQSTSVTQIATTWVMTLRTEAQIQTLQAYVEKTKSITKALIGHREKHQDGIEHWHSLIQFDRARARHFAGIWGGELKNMWIRPFQAYRDQTYQQALLNYIKYCTKEGPPRYSKNIDRELFAPISIVTNTQLTEEDTIMLEDEVAQTSENEETEKALLRPKKSKTSEIIRDKILAGAKPHDLYYEFPGCIPMIKQLLPLHKRKYTRTDCMYIYGQTGIGKTSNLTRVLNHFRSMGNIQYYFKVGGLSKFFNGYNWQDIVIIDDPVEPDKDSREEVQMFKTIINEREREIEIKGSSMPWDTRLVIITANIAPITLANACGPTCQEAVFRRLTQPFKPIHLQPNERERYTIYLIKMFLKISNLESEPPKTAEEIMLELDKIEAPVSDVEF